MSGIDKPDLLIAHVANSAQACKEQRERGTDESIQALCTSATSSYISSIPLISTQRSTQNRWNRYREFCEAHKIPSFPIVGPVVALWIYDISNGKEKGYEDGKTWDSHTTVLNQVRRSTLQYFSTSSTPRSVKDLTETNVLDFQPLKQYMAICRAHALATRGKRLAALESPARRTISSSQSHSNLSTLGVGESISASGRKRKHLQVPEPTTPTSASKKRPRKSSPAPNSSTLVTPGDVRRSARKSPATSKNWKSKYVLDSDDDEDDEEESDPAPTVRKTGTPKRGPGRPRKNPVPLPKSKTMGDLANETITSASSAAKSAAVAGRPRRGGKFASSASTSDLKEKAKKAKEEVVELKDEVVEQLTEDGPVGVGIFGKITRWFGWGA